MVIIKRDGTKEEFNADKIFNALTKAFEACGYTSVENVIRDMVSEMRHRIIIIKISYISKII